MPKQALPAGLLLLGGAGTRFVAFLLARSVRGALSKNTCTPSERFEGRRASASLERSAMLPLSVIPALRVLQRGMLK